LFQLDDLHRVDWLCKTSDSGALPLTKLHLSLTTFKPQNNMADRLTQLQDAVDQVGTISQITSLSMLMCPQLAHQFVACIHYVHRHHDLVPVSATDKVRDVKQESDGGELYNLVDFYR